MRVRLEGATDIGEMALFDPAAVEDMVPGTDAAAALEASGALARLPMQTDGEYRLDAFIDEEIPFTLRRYCGDARTGRLRLASGRLCFGGLESALRAPASPLLRSEATVPPGEYDLSVHEAEYPREVIQQAIDDRIGPRVGRLARIHGTIVGASVLFVVVALLAAGWRAALTAVLVGLMATILFRRAPALRAVEYEQREVERQFPAIVVQMRTRTPRGETIGA